METTYYLASQSDPRYERPEPKESLCQCELCGDNYELSATLEVDNEFHYCLRCVKRGRLTKHVLNDYPFERIPEMIKLINNFIFLKTCL